MAEEPDNTETGGGAEGAFAAALAELSACESLAQVAGWAAHWLRAIPEAAAALVWTPDPVNPVFTCTGASGEGLGRSLRRSVPRGDGLARRLIRDQEPFALSTADLLVTDDPWIEPVAKNFAACLALPLADEGGVVGLAAIFFGDEETDMNAALGAIATFVPDAALAIARALRQDKKIAGMLHAIERLTNLYDLSKAFGSTIEWEELTAIIARKAVDFSNGEIASLWILEGEEHEVVLGATAVNENYEIEDAPAAVGASVIAEIVTSGAELVDNELEDHPIRTENEPYEVKGVLAVPLLEDEATVGALVVVNKRGRNPRFSESDREMLVDLGHQAVRAIRNARRYLAEQKVEELDALLAVSREITATLDLDRVMNTVVNATSALIAFDRCAVAIMQRGKVRVGAVSGVSELNRSAPSSRRTETRLELVFFGGQPFSVTLEEDGELRGTDRPETEEKFRSFFEESGMHSYQAVILQDDEGKLGVIAFESAEPIVFDENTRDLLQILVNQATVALRNAQLYQQVPLAGFWKPLLEKKRQLSAMPKARLKRWGIGLAVAAILLAVVPWSIRLTGSARVVPTRRIAVTPPVDGVVVSVRRREGDAVARGEVVAQLGADSYQAALAEARSAVDIAQSDAARARADGDAPALAEASARRDEWQSKFAVAEHALQGTEIRAPADGIIVTPHIETRVGQFLKRGTDFAEIADLRTAVVEVAIPEDDALLLQKGQAVKVKLNAFPSRSFSGTITRLGAEVREDGENRFLTAEMEITNGSALIRSGMLGKAKINTGARPLGYALFRKPVRYLWAKIWPMLP